MGVNVDPAAKRDSHPNGNGKSQDVADQAAKERAGRGHEGKQHHTHQDEAERLRLRAEWVAHGHLLWPLPR